MHREGVSHIRIAARARAQQSLDHLADMDRKWRRPCGEMDVQEVDGTSTQFLVVLAHMKVQIGPSDSQRRQRRLELDWRTQMATVGRP